MTLFFRNLADVPVGEADDDALVEPLRTAFYDEEACVPARRAALAGWLRRYIARARQDAVPGPDRRERMNRVNPKYVLRNYLAQQSIDALEARRCLGHGAPDDGAAAPLRRTARAGGARGPAPRMGAPQGRLLGIVLQLVIQIEDARVDVQKVIAGRRVAVSSAPLSLGEGDEALGTMIIRSAGQVPVECHCAEARLPE